MEVHSKCNMTKCDLHRPRKFYPYFFRYEKKEFEIVPALKHRQYFKAPTMCKHSSLYTCHMLAHLIHKLPYEMKLVLL